MRTQRKPLEYKIRHHPTTSSTLCRTPHLNNKQNKNTNPVISGQDTTSLSLAHHRKTKQKLSTCLTLYEAHTKSWTNLRRAETKKKKESNLPQERINFYWSVGKGDLKHNNLKKKMKTQRNTAWMKEQTINTEVQNKWRGNRKITWKRIQNDDSKDDQKPWKQNRENARIN